ncbi:hypothetical protein L218DRAFT_973462 [Marasmius fiardii PR-910]|nr:hypothetical protein L218DRAFT_973462 [Marasmius fiardii PR-910]
MSFTRNDNLQLTDTVVNYTRGVGNTTQINYYADSSETRLSVLRSQVAFSALHDSEARYPQPNVLPGTRKEILERLCQWIEDPSEGNRVYWVNGAAGVGKSAIAQALSEKYIQTRRLAATFFFSRNDSTRNSLIPFLATSEVLQPFLAPFIHQTIHSMPEIFHKNWEVQFKRFIEEPCAQVDPRQWSQLPQLIIIDGKRLLRMIQNSTSTLPLDFLLFSRPEPHISRILFHESFTPSPLRLALADIEKYLRHSFARIWEEHRNTFSSSQAYWPHDSVIKELLRRATGQFIYATTIMKFIDTGKWPLTPVQRVVRSSSPYPDLDLLYSQILQFLHSVLGKLSASHGLGITIQL